jgi:hypothetical protein
MARSCASAGRARRGDAARAYPRGPRWLLAGAWLLAACTRAPSVDEAPGAAAAATVPGTARVEVVEPAAVDAAGDPAQLLARYLDIALARVASPDCLREDQAAWDAQTRAGCGADAACLDAARLARARTFEGLVPGAALERRLDALPADDAPQLFHVGGSVQATEAGERQPVAVMLEGAPYEDEGGFLLTGEGFDADAHAEFTALLGDEAAIEARFGDGEALKAGVVGILPAALFDEGALAALQAPAARHARLRVRGWAHPTDREPPVVEAGRCVVVEWVHGAR